MKHAVIMFVRIALVGFIWLIWWLVWKASLSYAMNLSIIAGGVLLTYPLAWLGRKILNRHQTMNSAVWTTTFVHLGMGFTFGIPIVRAVSTYKEWCGWVIPIPPAIGLVLVIITGAVVSLTVFNLALKGSGAPFFISLSKRLATDWMYARTRNPMALAAFAFFISLGIWFQSPMFILWVLILLAPAYVFFAKMYEERELEIRFGVSYLEYKSRTPMFFPGKPRR